MGQFDSLEKTILSSGQDFSSEITDLKTFLENKCKTSTKAIKSFLREKNLEINSGRHIFKQDKVFEVNGLMSD